MVARITQNLLAQRTLNDLNRQLAKISVLQERLATGQRVNRPSDDPIDARRAIDVRTLIAKNNRFQSNISDVGPQLQESATILLNAVEIMQRTLELSIQATNGTNAQPQLDAVALEIDQLLESLVAGANQRSNGRSLFAGTRTLSDAFSTTRVGGEISAVTYNGNAQIVQVDVSDGVRVDLNVSGSDAFQSTVDMFATLIGIRDELRAGNQAAVRTVRLDEIRQSIDQTLLGVARVGATQNQIDRVSNNLQDIVIQLQELLSDKVDADFAETILNLNVSQNAFEAGLNAAGRVLQPSLLDFVR